MVPVSVQFSKALMCYLNLSHLVPSNEQSRTWVVVCMHRSEVSPEIHEQIYGIVFPSFSLLHDLSTFQFPGASLFIFFSKNAGALGNLLGHILLLFYLLWGQALEKQKEETKSNGSCQMKRRIPIPHCFHCRLLLQSLLTFLQGYLRPWHERTKKRKKQFPYSHCALGVNFPTPGARTSELLLELSSYT